MNEKIYLDTCIWLNLFKKESEFWHSAQKLIDFIIFSPNRKLYYSGIVLKEIRFKLDEAAYNSRLDYFNKEPNLFYAALHPPDYSFARELEKTAEHSAKLSFFDLLTIALCKHNGFILVTRDKALLNEAQNHIKAATPEDLLSSM